MPVWEGFLVPVLEVLSDGVERGRREMFQLAADRAGLTEEQRSEVLDSGQTKANNRIGWALSALARSGAIDRPSRGRYVISERGRALLAEYPTVLTQRVLFPDGRGRRKASSSASTTGEAEDSALDPLEQVDEGVTRYNADVAVQLLERLRAQEPAFLEQAVLDLLVAMGYGGADKRVQRLGGSGDGGVDGVIDQDALGLDRVYVQAKRYAADNTVGRETIQAFVGALHGQHATRGIFITTSRFSAGAEEYAKGINARVILIDGERLARLMIRYGVGVQTKHTYRLVEIDEDFFE
ncbi:restriction endonuclease [Blastococcus sp. CCUG 61487]|uniref:restriction endonuclease n=1 Tax=Blastococcus sp. CCUG 61487 TaxID=1840703 RepID=UPI0010C0197A|nr:restriction endonuclease [Blastococcus sp. CCUG 61487]TKJ30152.1 restriction endonuclease [Blastococcus sp. CCUG 61487]